MKASAVRGLLHAGLLIAFVLHNDLWLWDDARLLGGLPVGLLYHVAFCVVVALWMALVVRFAWPHDLESRPDARPES